MNTLFFVETTSPRIRGPWFLEVDRDSNSRQFALDEIRRGGVVKVLAVNEDEGTCKNVTDELMGEAGPLPDDYRTPITGQDLIDWKHDRARSLAMSE